MDAPVASSLPPDILAHLEKLRPLKESPKAAGLFLDLDGTLCPLVDAPEKVEMAPETRQLLDTLDERFGTVVVISGRELTSLAGIVNLPSLTYVGNHGLEVLEDGHRRVLLPEHVAARMRALGADLERMFRGEDDTLLELKELSHAVHYRAASDPVRARDRILEVLRRVDLEGARITEGKMLVQIRPEFPLDKGKAVETLMQERDLSLALYAGDDTTDLDAFRSLTELQRQGSIQAYRVAVHHPDTPRDLLEQADYLAEGVEGITALLAWLAAPQLKDPEEG